MYTYTCCMIEPYIHQYKQTYAYKHMHIYICVYIYTWIYSTHIPVAWRTMHTQIYTHTCTRICTDIPIRALIHVFIHSTQIPTAWYNNKYLPACHQYLPHMHTHIYLHISRTVTCCMVERYMSSNSPPASPSEVLCPEGWRVGGANCCCTFEGFR